MIYSKNKNFLNKIVPKDDKIKLMEKLSLCLLKIIYHMILEKNLKI